MHVLWVSRHMPAYEFAIVLILAPPSQVAVRATQAGRLPEGQPDRVRGPTPRKTNTKKNVNDKRSADDCALGSARVRRRPHGCTTSRATPAVKGIDQFESSTNLSSRTTMVGRNPPSNVLKQCLIMHTCPSFLKHINLKYTIDCQSLSLQSFSTITQLLDVSLGMSGSLHAT